MKLIYGKTKKEEGLEQYMLFHNLINIANIIYWPFYYIYLFKVTNSFEDILLERIVFFISMWSGYMILSMLLERIGYLKALKLSLILQLIGFIFTILVLNDLSEFYLILAVINGLGHGSNFPYLNTYNLKEMHGVHRGYVIDILEAISRIEYVILPVLAGAIITLSGTFESIALVTIILFTLVLFIPWKTNKRPRAKIQSSEFTTILKRKHFNKFAFLHFFDMGITQIYTIIFMIVPYILIKSEFGVGALATLSGFAAAFLAFRERSLKLNQKIKAGYFAYILYTFGIILFAIFWNVPILTIRGIIVAIAVAIGTTTFGELDFSVREKLLGNFIGESANEMNMIVETIYLMGRLTAIISTYILLQLFEGSTEEFIRILLVVTSGYALISYHLFVRINKRLKIGESNMSMNSVITQ